MSLCFETNPEPKQINMKRQTPPLTANTTPLTADLGTLNVDTAPLKATCETMKIDATPLKGNLETLRVEPPNYLVRYVKGTRTLQHKGKTYCYFVVSAAFGVDNNAPRVFTICTKDDHILMISDEYPEEYRELGLIHEIIEYIDFAEKTGEHVCKKALQAELLLAEKQVSDFSEYKTFRLGFFEAMVEYYENKDRTPEEDQTLKGMKHSLEHLRKLTH